MKRGFTILELVIVISVLVILIGIAIPRIKGMQQSGNITKAKGELQTLQSAMESYYNNTKPHVYPVATPTPCATVFDSASPSIISNPLYDPFGATSTTEYDLVVNGSWYAFGSVGTGTNLSTFAIDSNGYVTKATGNLCATNGIGCATAAASSSPPTST